MEHLTEKQKEVWKQEEAHWDCWQKADVDRCMALMHPNVVTWPREMNGPSTKPLLREATVAIFKHITPGTVSVDLRVRSITFHGSGDDEIALVYYDGEIDWKDPQKGIDRHDEGRLFHVFARYQGEWLIIGGMTADLLKMSVQERWSST